MAVLPNAVVRERSMDFFEDFASIPSRQLPYCTNAERLHDTRGPVKPLDVILGCRVGCGDNQAGRLRTSRSNVEHTTSGPFEPPAQEMREETFDARVQQRSPELLRLFVPAVLNSFP
jgi:hypothetical protein